MALVHTAEEAAAIIGGDCKASWLKEKARLREIPFTMPGGRYGWTDAHIAEILAMLEVRPAPRQLPRSPVRPAPVPVPAADVPVLRARVPKRMAALRAGAA